MTVRLPSPLIKPDVRFSRIRLSDWLHRGHATERSTQRRLASSAPSWQHGTACSESSWHYAVLHRLAPSHPPSPSSTSTPEVRVLPSSGVTRPRRYYDPVRLPHRPMPCSTVEAATLATCGSPPITWLTVSTCDVHYPGGPAQVHLSAASPDHAARSVSTTLIHPGSASSPLRPDSCHFAHRIGKSH